HLEGLRRLARRLAHHRRRAGAGRARARRPGGQLLPRRRGDADGEVERRIGRQGGADGARDRPRARLGGGGAQIVVPFVIALTSRRAKFLPPWNAEGKPMGSLFLAAALTAASAPASPARDLVVLLPQGA